MLAFEPDNAVLVLLDGLPTRSRLALLTDNGPIVRAALPHALPSVAARFPTRLFSCTLGATKPDPALFDAAATALGEPPARLLLLDDSAAAVDGARAAGWRALHFTGVGGLSGQLAASLVGD